MSYAGRSPMNDVVRSVIVSAAMVSPALLEACKSGEGTPPVAPDHTNDMMPAPTASTDPSTSPTASVSPTTDPTTTAAPSTSVVRPRDPIDAPPQMPTRGFSGAARGRA